MLIFGVGYLMVARDPVRNRSILWLAVTGKTYVAIFWSWHFYLGNTLVFTLVGGLGDLVFACLFPRYLLKSRKWFYTAVSSFDPAKSAQSGKKFT